MSSCILKPVTDLVLIALILNQYVAVLYYIIARPTTFTGYDSDRMLIGILLACPISRCRRAYVLLTSLSFFFL